MICYDETPADHAFDLYLRTVNLDTVRIEQAAHMTPDEWHALARDRRTK